MTKRNRLHSRLKLSPGLQVTLLTVMLAAAGLFMASSPLARAAGVSGGTLTVLQPNGGEVLPIGRATDIKWRSRGVDGKIVLILYKKGIKHSVIAGQAPNNGRFRWHISNSIPPGNNYRIRIRSINNLSINDFSDRDFAIK